jgi:hypothetical protein
MNQITMGENAKKEDAALRRATGAAIADARKVALSSVPANTSISQLTDAQWNWIIGAAIFAWTRVRVEQAIELGIDAERSLLETGLSPSPCDAAVVHSILPALAAVAGIDWSLPLAAWSKDQMVGFLLTAWKLIGKAEAVRGREGIMKSEDWAATGDPIPF